MLNKKNYLVCLFFIMFSCLFSQANSVSLKAVDFGAVPDDGKNDRESLNSLFEYCKDNEVSDVEIAPGTYILSTERARTLEYEIYNGGFPNVPEVLYTPDFEYDRGLIISGCNNLTVHAEGVKLLIDGWMEPVSINNCSNIRIEGLTIDYKRRPNSTGKVIDVGTDYFDVEFYKRNKVDAKACFPRITFWNPETRIIYKDDFYVRAKEDLGNNSVRFFGRVSKDIQGLDAVAVHSLHFRPAILINETDKITLDSTVVNAQPGMGIVVNHSSDITFNKISVVPGDGSYQSSNTDATHFTSCFGKIVFEGCNFQGQGDDATNIHGFYHSILNGAGSKQCEMSVLWNQYDRNSIMNTHASILDYPDKGDSLALVKRSNLQQVDFFKVLENRQVPDNWSNIVSVDKNLPDDIEKYFFINISKLPSVEIKNCTVKSSLARGFLIKTSDVLIENCLVENITGTPVQLSAEGDWLEGSCASNVTVRNCKFINCGRGAGTQMNAAGISVNTKAPFRFKRHLYKNLNFIDNVISSGGAPYGIYLTCATDVVISGNSISGTIIPLVRLAVSNLTYSH